MVENEITQEIKKISETQEEILKIIGNLIRSLDTKEEGINFEDANFYTKKEICSILNICIPTVDKMMKGYEPTMLGRKKAWTGRDIKHALMRR